MIGIRADANEVVATGHIMRCMTIAGQLKKLGEEVIFFLADDYGISMLEEKCGVCCDAYGLGKADRRTSDFVSGN